MQIVSGLREKWRDMAGRALRCAIEKRLAALERSLVVGSGRRGRRRDRQLVEVERCELWRHTVGGAPHVRRAALRRDGILILVSQASIEERSGAVHLGGPDIRVPV